MKYECITNQCGNCGEEDDSCVGDIERAIQTRIEKDDGTVIYVCLECAAVVFQISEARAVLQDYPPQEDSDRFWQDKGINLLTELEAIHAKSA